MENLGILFQKDVRNTIENAFTETPRLVDLALFAESQDTRDAVHGLITEHVIETSNGWVRRVHTMTRILTLGEPYRMRLLSDLVARLGPYEGAVFTHVASKFELLSKTLESSATLVFQFGFDTDLADVMLASYNSYARDGWSWIQAAMDNSEDYDDLDLGAVSPDELTNAICIVLEDVFA